MAPGAHLQAAWSPAPWPHGAQACRWGPHRLLVAAVPAFAPECLASLRRLVPHPPCRRSWHEPPPVPDLPGVRMRRRAETLLQATCTAAGCRALPASRAANWTRRQAARAGLITPTPS